MVKYYFSLEESVIIKIIPGFFFQYYNNNFDYYTFFYAIKYDLYLKKWPRSRPGFGPGQIQDPESRQNLSTDLFTPSTPTIDIVLGWYKWEAGKRKAIWKTSVLQQVCIYIFKVVISVYPIIIQKPLDQFASNFYYGTRTTGSMTKRG